MLMSQTGDANEFQVVRINRHFGGDWLDIWLTLAVVAGVVLGLAYFIAGLPKEATPTLLLAGTTAVVIGWGAGIMFSPYGGREQLSSFGTGRLLLGLIVGFLVAWFWQPIKQLFASCGPMASDFMSSALFPIAVIAFVMFLTTMLTTFVLRRLNRFQND